MPNTIGELSAVELSAAIRNKKVSAREALAEHLERIAEVNPGAQRRGDTRRGRRPRWQHRADQLTASGAELPPLHGLPMTHKDTNNTAGMRTTQGSLALRDFVPEG
jgi:amidase